MKLLNSKASATNAGRGAAPGVVAGDASGGPPGRPQGERPRTERGWRAAGPATKLPGDRPSIPYGRQEIGDDDIEAVVNVLRSPFLTTGPKVSEFEEAVAKEVGARYAVAVSSGTAALHIATLAAGIKPGDEVLVPTLSFLASANCVLYAGAKPVFVDSAPGGFNLDLEDARRKITRRTKAIVPVDFAGEPFDHDALRALARKHKLAVIEDAAHALGARDAGRPVGSLADMTVFSFHPVKHITTAEGGMIMTDDARLAGRLRRLRHHGIDVDVRTRDARQSWKYDMVELGFNYRLSDLQCALGLSQLRKLERFLRRREEIAAFYDRAFRADPRVEIPPRSARAGDRHAWHLYILRLKGGSGPESRNRLFKELREGGIGVHVHYRPIHLHPFYRAKGYRPGLCPNAERAFDRILTLPLFPGLTDADLVRVERTVKNALASTAGGGRP